MIVGCYSLHLYCELCNEFEDGFDMPKTFAEAIKQAKAKGWKFSKDKKRCYCPRCKGNAFAK